MGFLERRAAESELRVMAQLTADIRSLAPAMHTTAVVVPCHIETELHNSVGVVFPEGAIGLYRCEGHFWCVQIPVDALPIVTKDNSAYKPELAVLYGVGPIVDDLGPTSSGGTASLAAVVAARANDLLSDAFSSGGDDAVIADQISGQPSAPDNDGHQPTSTLETSNPGVAGRSTETAAALAGIRGILLNVGVDVSSGALNDSSGSLMGFWIQLAGRLECRAVLDGTGENVSFTTLIDGGRVLEIRRLTPTNDSMRLAIVLLSIAVDDLLGLLQGRRTDWGSVDQLVQEAYPELDADAARLRASFDVAGLVHAWLDVAVGIPLNLERSMIAGGEVATLARFSDVAPRTVDARRINEYVTRLASRPT